MVRDLVVDGVSDAVGELLARATGSDQRATEDDLAYACRSVGG